MFTSDWYTRVPIIYNFTSSTLWLTTFCKPFQFHSPHITIKCPFQGGLPRGIHVTSSMSATRSMPPHTVSGTLALQTLPVKPLMRDRPGDLIASCIFYQHYRKSMQNMYHYRKLFVSIIIYRGRHKQIKTCEK